MTIRWKNIKREYLQARGLLLTGRSERRFAQRGGINGATGKFRGRYISLETYMNIAGGLHSIQNETPSTPPYYGEVPYAGRRIVRGFNYGVQLRK